MQNTQLSINCNFCGKSRTEVDKLVVAQDAGICNECIELCSKILDKEKNEKIRAEKKLDELLDPVKIKQHLDQYVIGQNQAKIALSVGVVNHFKRIFLNPTVEIEKSNIIMFGPTGSGKTLLAKSIARYLNIPFVIADATTLTEAGYVGDDVETVVARLLAASDYDVKRCETGIIFIDEIDKIGRKSEGPSLTRDVSGEGVQQALLKLVEGAKCTVSATPGRGKHPALQQIEVDTSNILFIAAGAFTDLDRVLEKRQSKVGMGFGATVDHNDPDRTKTLPEDFIHYGMIPEFTGRFPVVVHTDKLTENDLIQILTGTKNSLVKQMQFYFETDGIDLTFEESAIQLIAKKAIDLEVGARGLKTILETILQPFLFDIVEIKRQGVTELIVNDTIILEHYPDQKN